MQHNCIRNKCEATGSRPIFEEREFTGRSQPIVQHTNKNDLILNTAQMRDAVHLQKLRIPAPLITEEQSRRLLADAVDKHT